MTTPTTSAPAVIDLRDRRDDETLTVSLVGLRRIRFAAVAALVVLNVLDLVTTRMFLNRGLEEGNALADVLLGTGSMPFVKAAILLGLGWSSLRSAPRIGTTCAMWCVVGIYTTIIAVNCMALASLS